MHVAAALREIRSIVPNLCPFASSAAVHTLGRLSWGIPVLRVVLHGLVASFAGRLPQRVSFRQRSQSCRLHIQLQDLHEVPFLCG